jgi:hypothetical protein
MTFNPPATLAHAGSPALRLGFTTHKYLLLAILECQQQRQPRRGSVPTGERDTSATHRWMREPSAEREATPCIVMREHHDRGDLSVAQVALHDRYLHTQPLADWMRRTLAPTSQPDRDILHLAMAPTLPGVPMLFHSIAADGETITHMFAHSVWSVCSDVQFLLRAIRYAQLVATAIPLSGSASQPMSGPPDVKAPGDGGADGPVCDLSMLGRVYDHIAVHAAILELCEFRRGRKRP